MTVSPIVSALFANSPLVDGRECGYLDYRYQADDILLFGRESAGVPAEVNVLIGWRMTQFIEDIAQPGNRTNLESCRCAFVQLVRL